MGKAINLYVYDDSRGHRTTCRSCGAHVVWFELISGKRHPFNAEQDGDPVYLRTQLEDATRRMIGVLSSDESHFATCPDAKQWSRR